MTTDVLKHFNETWELPPGVPTDFSPVLAHLHQGGSFGYWWTASEAKNGNSQPAEKLTFWWEVGSPDAPPEESGKFGPRHIYFGVHPTTVRREKYQRAKLEHIAAINCLFSEFDAKDFGGGKDEAALHIANLNPPPTAVIDSGGGYHCYWLLASPFVFQGDDDRQHARRLQATWVNFTGGDNGAKDLARVLRLPGTVNYKPDYGPDFPTVEVIEFHPDRLYDLGGLEALLPPGKTPKQDASGSARTYTLTDDLISAKKNLDRLAQWRCDDYAQWVTVGMALQDGLGDLGLKLWQEWSRRSVKHKPGDCEARWRGFGNYSGPPVTLATLGAWANEDEPPEQSSDQAGDRQESRPGKKKPPAPTHDVLADRWLSTAKNTVYGLGDWRRYEAGLWPVVSDLVIRREVKAVAVAAKSEGVRPTDGLIASVANLAKYEVAKDDDSVWDANPDYLVCHNGTLHIPTRTLGEHDPGLYATSGVDYDYDPAAAAPHWDYFLTTTVSEDVASFLQEFAGYALTTETKYELAVWLYGPPGGGKSTFLGGLESMLGDRVGVLGLAEVERSRFALAHLPGKTLIIAAEQPGSYLASTHILNAIISGEPIPVDRKFREPIIVTPRCKIAWGMNELPRVSDPNSGLFRRVKVVELPAIPVEDQDPGLKKRIKAEGAGILNWSLAGLDRLRERGRFHIPMEVTTATETFKQSNDIPAAFVAECCITGPEYKMQSKLLYDAYKSWCFETGHKPQSSTTIAADWRRLGFERYRAAGKTFWRGIGLIEV